MVLHSFGYLFDLVNIMVNTTYYSVDSIDLSRLYV